MQHERDARGTEGGSNERDARGTEGGSKGYLFDWGLPGKADGLLEDELRVPAMFAGCEHSTAARYRGPQHIL